MTFNQEAFEVYCEYHGIAADPEVYGEEFEDSFCGEISLQEYTEQMVDEGCFGNIPEAILPYIDISAIVHDLKCDGYWEEDGFCFRPV